MKLLWAVLIASTLAWPQTLATGWKLRPAGQQVPLEDFPMSSTLTKDGKFLFVLHSGKAPSIVVLETAGWRVAARATIPDGWLGLTLSPDQKVLYVGGGSRNSVLEFTWSGTELKQARELGAASGTLAAADFIGDVAISPDGRLLYAAEVFRDSVIVINPQSGRMTERFKTGRRPYRMRFAPDGKTFFVTSWAEGTLYQHETANGAELSRLRLGPQTTDLLLSDRKVPDDDSGSRLRLFVASSNSNNIFVVGVNDVREMKQLEVLNIGTTPAQPAGMTPSALAMSAHQTQLYIACSDANALAAVDISEPRSRLVGFIPTGAYPTSVEVGADGKIAAVNAQSGTLSVIAAPADTALATQTQVVLENTPYKPEMAQEVAAAKSVFEQVVYILTDRPVQGPNHTKLSGEFTRFSNFQAPGAIPAENHLWSTAAIAPAFMRRLLPARSANRLRFANFAGGEPANLPPAGYLWSNAKTAGLTVRNYGEFVENDRVTDPSLAGITNLGFKGTDDERARVFLDEWKQLETAGKLPQLAILRMAGDDAPLGRIIEALSKSAQWSKTVVFVAGMNGETLLTLSAYSRRGASDAGAYSPLSVLRTIELILGLRPMTQFDAAARSLTSAFGTTSNLTPYMAATP